MNTLFGVVSCAEASTRVLPRYFPTLECTSRESYQHSSRSHDIYCCMNHFCYSPLPGLKHNAPLIHVYNDYKKKTEEKEFYSKHFVSSASCIVIIGYVIQAGEGADMT